VVVMLLLLVMLMLMTVMVVLVVVVLVVVVVFVLGDGGGSGGGCGVVMVVVVVVMVWQCNVLAAEERDGPASSQRIHLTVPRLVFRPTCATCQRARQEVSEGQGQHTAPAERANSRPFKAEAHQLGTRTRHLR
jgi:hypothetical protein